ncbi:hypothetical protein TTE1064 [Caldanaerobacter subterraneus subsp. tengcongensis MB4]|uniref:Uncharacterized protein n=1 Tax=Caldanaerobacter subterraneus subsp. tengcongensis (strain DSM 15242 / JCM 11007 / NBRC 100824 / MB4) TaxID=273068 RepID=Q8RAX1_CALS4|nr:hypothetical protein TTE1064 [Caldanaerobacter subterraneus subsp. tengcongensis MB4]
MANLRSEGGASKASGHLSLKGELAEYLSGTMNIFLSPIAFIFPLFLYHLPEMNLILPSSSFLLQN